MARKATDEEKAQKDEIAQQKQNLESGNFPEGAPAPGDDQNQGSGKLEDVLNEGKTVRAGGKSFIIRKWVLKDFLKLSQLLLDLNLDFDKMQKMNIDANFVLDLLLMKSEIITKIIAFTIKEDILFVENLDLDEAVELGLEIWQGNQESFFRTWAKIKPLLQNSLGDQQPPKQEESPQSEETAMIGST